MNDGLLFALSALALVMVVLGGYLAYLLRRAGFARDELSRQDDRHQSNP